MIGRAWPLLFACLAAAVAFAVTALPSFAADATPDMQVLRGPQPTAETPKLRSRQTEPSPVRDFVDDPRTAGFSYDSARRIGGMASNRQGGGAQCRQSCAQTYYFCLAGQVADDCSQTWGQCLRRCPSVSSDRY